MPKRWTTQMYADAVQKVHGKKLKVLGTYTNNATGVLLKCTNCKHKWSPKPRDVIHAESGCPSCTVAPLRTTTLEYKRKLSAINHTIECIEEYAGYTVKILHRCKKCQHEWKITPNNTLFKHGCPACKVDANTFKRREVLFGRRLVNVQGYEPQALKYLLSRGVNPKHVLVSTREGKPSIRYTFEGKEKVYVADFYHTKRNRLIEVKSTHTLGLGKQLRSNWKQMKAKAKACIEQGYDFVMLLMTQKGERIMLPKNWYTMSRKEVLKYI